MQPSNPYNERGLIRENQKFFGRKRELREAFSNLQNMQSVSVVGQRRIGKSSFLYRIAHPQPEELNASFKLYYLDLQRVFSVEEFYERACKLLGREDGQSHLDLEEAIQEKRVILCLDEFEQAYKENFGSEFFNALRSLAQTGNLALAVATQEQLSDLHRIFLQDEDVTSKFHNIFARLELGEFTNAEAREMVETPRNGSRFNDDEIAFILRLGQTHPHWLNLACALVYEAKRNGISDPQEIECQFNAQRGLNESEKTTDSDIYETTTRPKSKRIPDYKSHLNTPEEKTTESITDPNASLRWALLLALIALVVGSFSANASFAPGMFISVTMLAVSLVLILAKTFLWRGGTQ